MTVIDQSLSGYDGDMTQQFYLLPAGTYTAHIKHVDYKASKSGNNMLVIDWTILEGEHEGSSLREYLVLTGYGQRMGLQRLKAIMVGIGSAEAEHLYDTDELLEMPCQIEVVCKNESFQNKETGEESVRLQNRIQKYLPLPLNPDYESYSQPAAEAAPVPPSSAPAPAAAANPVPPAPKTETPFKPGTAKIAVQPAEKKSAAPDGDAPPF